MTASDSWLREQLIHRALELRHAQTSSRSPTWTREQLQQATARNHQALATALAVHRTEPGMPADRQLDDREAEP